MNKDSKILLIALIIIIVGAISFNYADMTGKITSDQTIININPKVVKAGESLNIGIIPGKQGVYSEIEFYRVGETDMKLSGYGYVPKICKTTKCYERSIVNYKISVSWDNNDEWSYETPSKTYYARVYDIYSGTYKVAYFTVERAYKAAGPAEHR